MKTQGLAPGLLAILLANGCSGPPARSLLIEGVTYTFPADHVRGFLPPDKGGPYVRLLPPKSGVILEHSETIKWPHQQGPGVPTIAHINDVPREPSFTVDVSHVEGIQIVCFSAKLDYTCGFRLFDGGVPWSIRFSERDKADVARIRTSASAYLRSYRRRGDATLVVNP